METRLGLLYLIYRQTKKKKPMTFEAFRASGANSEDALCAIQTMVEAGIAHETEAGVFKVNSNTALKEFLRENEPPKTSLSTNSAKLGAESIHKTNTKNAFLMISKEQFGCKPTEFCREKDKTLSYLGNVMRLITAKLLKMEDGIIYCAIDEKSVDSVLNFLSELEAKDVKRAKSRDHTRRKYERELNIDSYRPIDFSDDEEEKERDYRSRRFSYGPPPGYFDDKKNKYVDDDEDEDDDLFSFNFDDDDEDDSYDDEDAYDEDDFCEDIEDDDSDTDEDGEDSD